MIRVLVVDDSSFMRKALTHLLESNSDIKVSGAAADGAEAIKLVKETRPDVVVLDIAMPVMDGLTALAHIMNDCPTPVVILSGLSVSDANIAMKCLDHGAVDFVPKPSGLISYDIEKVRNELIAKVKAAEGVAVNRLPLRLPAAPREPRRAQAAKPHEVIIIGASTGGPKALLTVIADLPAVFAAAILIVQHMGEEFIPSFVQHLQSASALHIAVAKRGASLEPGQVLVAPGGRHTVISDHGAGKRIEFNRRQSPDAFRPSIDCAMESAAAAYAAGSCGVLLTGLGNDGAQGMKAIKEAGGYTIAEDKSTSMVFSMPKSAIDLHVVDEVLPLPQIAAAIMRAAPAAA